MLLKTMDTLACNSLFYSTLLQRVGFEKYRSPTSGGNSLVKSRRCKKPILIKWRFRIIFYLMTGTISYPFCNLEFTPCECKKGTDWPTAKDRQRRAARHGQAGWNINVLVWRLRPIFNFHTKCNVFFLCFKFLSYVKFIMAWYLVNIFPIILKAKTEFYQWILGARKSPNV